MASNVETTCSSTSLIKEKIQRLKCVNRRCKHGSDLITANGMVCRFYHVNIKPDKQVCSVCFRRCIKHYKCLEKKFLNGECILDGKFQNYGSHHVIESSSDEQDGYDDKTEVEDISFINITDDKIYSDSMKCVFKGVEFAVFSIMNKHNGMLKNQYELCDNYIKKKLHACDQSRTEFDELITKLSEDIKALKNNIYNPYTPVVINTGSVDLDDMENVCVMKSMKNKTNLEIDMEKENNKEDKENNKDDNIEDVIAITSTICPIPADLPKEGSLEYPPLSEGQFVYAMKGTLKQPWFKCRVLSLINDDYVHVKFDSNEKLLMIKEIAYFTQNPVQFPVGSRIISKFSDTNRTFTDSFYAGVIGEPPKLLNQFRYLIFFDDGNVQYQYHKNIRLVPHKTNQVWNDVHPDLKEFIQNYLKNYPERQMVRLTKKHFIRAAHQSKWQSAKVLEIDGSLVKLYFVDLKYSEWLYRGSPRLYNIYEKQCKLMKGIRCRQSGLAYLNKPFVEFTSAEEPVIAIKTGVARKSTTVKSSVVTPMSDECENAIKYNDSTAFKVIIQPLPKTIPKPKKFIIHSCDSSCVDWTDYCYDKTMRISMLATPIHYGFSRQLVYFNVGQKCVWYKTPCGRIIRNVKDMHDYLIVTKSTMTIDQFDFNSWVRPMAEFKVLKSLKFMLDITAGKEFRVISCVNNINNKLPSPMEYMTTRRPMPGVNINVESSFLCGCDCTDNCQDKSKCACWKMTIEGQNILPTMYKDPNIGYNYRRLPERVLTGIYECNKTCKCSSTCLNRVVQNPLSQKLQLFLTEKKGWGVRCMNDIPQGSFICVYVGCLLTEADANEGGKNYGDEYLAELDYIEVLEKIKEDYENDVPENILMDNDSNKNGKNVAIFESSDEDFQRTSEGNSRVSDIALRLRKRKKPQNDTKTKKDGKHVQITTKLNARDMENNPEASKSAREYFGENESVYIMDAKTSGNVGRYLNHSCSPNTYVQNVFVDTHDLRFPWVSFFALHYIQAGTELTWDYSYDIGSVPGKVLKCHCESVYCRGRLL